MLNGIAIPVKKLAEAKTRLSCVLSPVERSRLAVAMFQDVLTTAKRCPEVDWIAVVTSDEDIARLTKENDAEILLEDRSYGLNQAVGSAVKHAVKAGVNRLLILHSDLPLIKPSDLAQFFQPSPEVIIAPSHLRDGTNALSLSPPDAIRLRYGRMSFDRHLAFAREKGFNPLVICNDRIALDIDTWRDLKKLRSLSPTGSTGEFLRLSCIGERQRMSVREPFMRRKAMAP